MTILNIRPARRTGSKVVIGIAGISGSGKTLTALYLARGMVDSPEEIGFLDTENRRGSLYADVLDGQFMIGDLYPPFSPQRYSQAIKEFQDAGVKVLVIDSVTHEWEGEGGCEDIANNTNSRMADWKKAKFEHKKFMNTLLQSDMHIICCIRAREKTDFRNPSKPVSLGIQPITEKNFMFEMTASMLMHDSGMRQEFLKVPEALKPAFGAGNNYLGNETGRFIRQWVDAGDKTDVDLDQFKAKMQMATSGGLDALKKEWLTMDSATMKRMKPFWPQFEASALEYDSIAAAEKQTEPNAVDDLPPPPQQAQQPAQQTASTSRTDI